MKKIVTMFIILAVAIPCFAQPEEGGRNRERRGRFNREEMMKRRSERLKSELGMSDEEWTAVQPMITDIMQTRMRNMMRGMRGRRPRGPEGMRGRPEGGPEGTRGRPEGGPEGMRGRPEGAPGAPEIPEGVQALQTVLENKEATPEQIANALAKFRAEVAKREAEEKAKQDKLKTVLTARQEAQLVLMGILK